MSRGLPGLVRRAGSCCVVGLVLLTGCTADDAQVAIGADVDRPTEASIDFVDFTDVASEVGLDFRHGAFRWEVSPDPAAMMGGGVCWIDYDRDGWLDLYAVNTWSNSEWGRWRSEGALPSSRLYRNEAGRFVDVTDTTATGIETRGNGCVAADLDLDGWTDLYVTTERDNVLLWNDDGERFVDDADRAEPSGAAVFGWHAGATVGDIDGNGWPDIFVAGYTDMNRPITSATGGFPNTHEPEPDLLLLNDGPGGDARTRFRNVAGEVGIEPTGADYGLGAILSDLDGDGDLDVYVANDTHPNQLYENVPDGGRDGFRLVEQGISAGVGDDGAGMGIAVGDADGDGAADLVTTNQLDERHRVMYNASVAPLGFFDAAAAAGLPDLGVGSTGWGATWVDVDLDSDLDLFVGQGAIPVRGVPEDLELALLVENRGGSGVASLADATATVGLDIVGPRLGRGVAAADYDNDGDVDIALGTIGGDLTLLRNSGAGGTWLEVATPTPIPGLVVTVDIDGATVLRRSITVGGSYLSSEDPRAHFGLNGATAARTVTVEWPNGTIAIYSDVAAGQILQVEEDDAE